VSTSASVTAAGPERARQSLRRLLQSTQVAVAAWWVAVMGELGAATRAMQGIDRDYSGERMLAERICRACMDGLDVDGAVLSLMTARESRTTLWASDTTAQRLEDLQFTLNEGACMEAATTGRQVLIPDLLDDAGTARWPMFAAAATEHTGVRALFALPLQWGTVNLGVLDLYRMAPGGLSTAQYRDAVSAADTAALMILGHRTDPAGPHNDSRGHDGDGAEGLGWLEPAISYRAEIHQATGMVLAQLGISATDALARMRAHAFVEQRLLLDVAHDVVSGTWPSARSDSTDRG
jgi:hypothetical protein